MHVDTLRRYLDDFETAEPWLTGMGLKQLKRGHGNLVRLAEQGVTLDLLAAMAEQLERLLPQCPDPDMALNNLDRYFAGERSPLSIAALFQRDPRALEILVQLFSTSQYFSDLVISDPEFVEELRLSHGRPVPPDRMRELLQAEVDALGDRRAVADTLRRFVRRETLRIGYGDIIVGQPLEVVTAQLSHLADVVVDVALRSERRRLEERLGVPVRHDGAPARFVVLAMGKLGGLELNYSSDIDLVFLYDAEGKTGAPQHVTNQEFFTRLATDLVKMLAEHTERGYAYRVDLRLRPEGQRGLVAQSLESTLAYYDTLGRTWERQALIKARAIAGNLDLGREFIERIEPWIYRLYLNVAEISEIRALKRRIEHRTRDRGEELVEVKTGHGGIRDVEFSIQFLQLLGGGGLPRVRTGNTLDAIGELEAAGCLTDQERQILEGTYRFLRKVEHRLQTLFDLQTHRVPSMMDEQRKLAIRMGYRDMNGRTAEERFLADYQRNTTLNRRILDHLLHDAFPDQPGGEPEPEVDLVLDPNPEPETIQQVLGRYPFKDVRAAYENLTRLAEESVVFLSTPRCRHFLASIAPRLLEAVAATPDPDLALTNLEKVSASLGGKGVLWELFSDNPPTLHLYVDLCASSQLLSEILITHPGMIDELMDSLVLNQPRSLEDLKQELTDLCRGAEDPEPILHSFRNKELLRIGVRDILGKDDLRGTTRALSDLAEVVLGQVMRLEYAALVSRLGEPTVAEGPRAGEVSRPAVLALGKFGGRELGYHSDLDVVFLYEADGSTAPPRPYADSTTNFHFYSELAQHVIRTMSRLSPHGRLYSIDARLRPTGRSGSLALPLDEFRRYYTQGSGQLWERQALVKARIVFGEPDLAAEVSRAAEEAAYSHPWEPAMAAEIWNMRRRLEAAGGVSNLKRGFGGIVDIEFLAQMLQLKHGRECPEVRCPGTLEALEALAAKEFLSRKRYELFRDNYVFLRTVESRLRLAYNVSRDDLPESPEAVDKLARRLGYEQQDDRSATDPFLEDCSQRTTRTREGLLEVLGEETGEPLPEG